LSRRHAIAADDDPALASELKWTNREGLVGPVARAPGLAFLAHVPVFLLSGFAGLMTDGDGHKWAVHV